MEDEKIMTRQQAAELGLQTYFNGRPCIHGHRGRYTKTGACVECVKGHVVSYRQRRNAEIKQLISAARAGA